MQRNTVTMIAIALTAGLIGGIVGQFSSPVEAQWRDVIKADQFRLVDFSGTDRARLGLSGGDQQFTYFYLMDRNGNPRVEFTVYPDNRTPKIEFVDKRRRTVAALPNGGVGARLDRIAPARLPGGRGDDKADRASVADVRTLTQMINVLYGKVEEIRRELNKLAE